MMGIGMISIDGLASGLDISSIVSSLMAVERIPVHQLESRQVNLINKLTSYQELNTRLLALQTQAQSLTDVGDLLARTAGSTNTDVVTATIQSGAPLASYDIVVTTLASAHKVSSASFTDSTTALALSGEILVNGKVVDIETQDTLASIRNKINGASAGVTASILTVSETDARLVITSDSQGAANAIDLADASANDVLESLGLLTSGTSIKTAITNGAASDFLDAQTTAVGTELGLSAAPSGTVTINGTGVAINLANDSLSDIATAITTTVADVTATVVSEEVDGQTQYRLEIVGDAGTPTFADDNNVLVTLGVLEKTVADELTQAADATLTVDGVAVSRPTNTITGLAEGVTFHLLQEAPSETVRVQVTQDNTGTEDAIRALVDQFNGLMDFLNTQQDFDSDTGVSGTLFAQWPVSSIQAGLRSAASATVQVLGGAYGLLSQIGISASVTDRLQIDGSRLAAAIADDPEAVAELFATTTRVTDARVQVVTVDAATASSGSEGYALDITAVATRASVTGNDISAGLAQDETLTINGETTVVLTAGMSTDQVVDAINDALEEAGIEARTSNASGAVKLESDYYGSKHVLQIASSRGSGTAGSTGLGAETAGETAQYAGTDVEGTINGEAATGDGRILTGDAQNETTAGLVVRIATTSTGDHGTVMVTKGVATRLVEYAAQMAEGENSLLKVTTTGLEEQIERVDAEIERMEERIMLRQEQLVRRFISMEAILSQLQAQSRMLTSSLAALQTFQNPS